MSMRERDLDQTKNGGSFADSAYSSGPSIITLRTKQDGNADDFKLTVGSIGITQTNDSGSLLNNMTVDKKRVGWQSTDKKQITEKKRPRVSDLTKAEVSLTTINAATDDNETLATSRRFKSKSILME